MSPGETAAPNAGDVIEAVVARIEQYGVWLDYQGLAVLVNIPEVSWAAISHPSEVVAVGQRLWVVVLHRAGERISASLREMHPEGNPWRDPVVFAVGTEHTGPVVWVMRYGAFVQIVAGVRGLVGREAGKDLPVVGQRVRVRVMEVDAERRRVLLGWVGVEG